MLYLIYLMVIICGANSALYYDTYTGTEITIEDVKRHDKANTTFWCVSEIEPCHPNEGRRVDGSCNNLQHPAVGVQHTPFVRVLPPVYDKNFEPRKAASGNDLPQARYLRTRTVSVGYVPSRIFTTLAVNYLAFMSADIVSLHDTVNYIQWKTYCCAERGKTDRECVPIKIPDDDPVHRFSSYRCLNLTRPMSFQSIGCTRNDTTPDRIVSATPLLDLSIIYGPQQKALMETGRLFKDGLLKTEVDDGKIWPPTFKLPNFCYLNQLPRETRCHMTPEPAVNTLAGINIVSVWFWRYHNFIANELRKVNPCWDDNKLFETARDINIAIAIQIYYYETLPLFLGYYNMVRDQVINPSGGFRDEYNENILPQMSLEYPFALRWLHNIQDGAMKLYDQDGYYLKQVPIVNFTLRTGFFAIDNNMAYVTQGNFRQGSAKPDYIADPDITEQGMGGHQAVLDIVTNDLAKNRYFGFQPYIKYLEFCFNKIVHTFKDLEGIIVDEKIDVFSELYEKVEDIDLLAGIWAEIPIEGGHVPPTMYCLVIDQLKRNMYSDRHWYERPNRPKAFNYYQLAQIRRITIARILCDVGDSVTSIQPQAFLRASKTNPMTSCENIVQMNFWAWRDKSCDPSHFSGHKVM